MFGLFDKSKKMKKEARIRAESWWKSQNILGIKEKSKQCIFCGKEIPRLQGYLFSRSHVLDNDKYMNAEISRLEEKGIPSEQAQNMIWEKIESVYEDWLTCEDCLSRFM